jgi:choloylglycine hydrolase
MSTWGVLLGQLRLRCGSRQWFEGRALPAVDGGGAGEQEALTVHLTFNPASGDSAVVEYIAGRIKVYHDWKYIVMTNQSGE